ncbi:MULTISPECIES: hypothetical protein [unclassified Aureimonas]|uniref:hypothetical protein n=1 Tax=unclassified Aureimonas TaxID=2615206 RepID=UPI000701DD5C|nr:MULTISPECIES: hypothetical protein [unclassified Aureimonas]KQT52786.1 hypothetical protein ASG62_12705 [Aureimonas sp. Leaf427]KQT80245.1 hypothetical protein ASG54_06555 [Aureimonas sp. Leaf460]
MTATTNQPTGARKPRPIWTLARRLGVQAVLSVTVMAGLHLASVGGYDIRDLLPERAPGVAGPALPSADPVRVTGVPVRFDLPVQAGSALDHILPKPPAEEVAAVVPPSPAPAAAREARPAVLPSAAHVAVPTPRPQPRLAAAIRPAAVPPRPSEVPFDVSPRGLEIYGVAELAAEESPPMPIQLADAGFRVGDLVPSGGAILTRTAEVTGSAAHAVTGTATRLLDLVR